MKTTAIIVVLLFVTSVLAAAPAVRLAPVAQGFKMPVHLAQPPRDPSLYVVEQAGRIVQLQDGKILAKPFLDIHSKVVSGGEQGLLSIAFHPQYASNGRYFIYYTATVEGVGTVLRIAEVSSRTNAEKMILEIPHAKFSNHNGGQLAFDSKGHLYIGTGDGGGAGDSLGNGQNTQALLGKMLRIDIDKPSPSKPYGIPSDNPFVRSGGRPEIFAWGLRNPWRFSFDRETGLLFAADVGQNAWEEIDIVERGKNYGWNAMEGTHCYPPGDKCEPTKYAAPLFEYPQSEGFSVTGGFVYRGKTVPDLVGKYIFGDYGSGRIWALSWDPKTKKYTGREMLLATSKPISSFGEDAAGEIYVLFHAQGSVQKIVPK